MESIFYEAVVMRMGCAFGSLLMLLSFVLMGFFMLPLIFEDNETVMDWQTAVVCGQGERFTTAFTTQSDLRGTVRGGQVYCVAEDGTQTNVTGRTMLYALIGFTLPFLAGLVLTMRGMAGAALRVAGSAVQIDRQTFPLDPKSTDVNAILRNFGVSLDDVQPSDPDGGRTLTAQLQDLQAAYDQRLLTREEYERARQQIIDNATRRP